MKPIFRNAMFGFNKEDVFHFITKQNKQYTDLTLELEKQKNELVKEREAYERDTTELEALKAAVENANARLESITNLVDEILCDKNKIVLCASAIQAEKAAEKEQFDALLTRVSEAEKLRGKAEKFDQLSVVLSSIFNQNAQDLNSDAESIASPVEIAPLENKAVSELFELLYAFSSHCENLQLALAEVEKDA